MRPGEGDGVDDPRRLRADGRRITVGPNGDQPLALLHLNQPNVPVVREIGVGESHVDVVERPHAEAIRIDRVVQLWMVGWLLDHLDVGASDHVRHCVTGRVASGRQVPGLLEFDGQPRVLSGGLLEEHVGDACPGLGDVDQRPSEALLL
jgi:hypothetical protein